MTFPTLGLAAKTSLQNPSHFRPLLVARRSTGDWHLVTAASLHASARLELPRPVTHLSSCVVGASRYVALVMNSGGHSAMDTNVPDLALWSKRAKQSEPYPLLCHLLDTAAAAAVLWRSWLRPGLRDLLTEAIAPGNEDLARRRFALVAGLHDVGKANPVFQGQTMSPRLEEWVVSFRQALHDGGYADGPGPSDVVFEEAKTCARRHEVVGRRALGGVPEGRDDPTRSWLQAVVGGHHGRMHSYDDPQRITDETVSGLCEGSWGAQQRAHVDTLLFAVGLDALPPRLVGESAVALILASGLTSLSDWFASDIVSVRAGLALRSSGLNPATDPRGWLAERTTWL